MDSSELKRFDSDGLFRLARSLLGSQAWCAVYTRDGERATGSPGHEKRLSAKLKDLPLASSWQVVSDVPRKVSRASAMEDQCAFSTTLTDFAGSPIGTLVLLTEGEPSNTQLIQFVDALGEVIEAQVQREAELEAMAVELTGRYEELNLLYHAEDETAGVEQTNAALQHLVDNCVEHLHVTLVGLCLPKLRQVLFAGRPDGRLHDPHSLLIGIQQRLMNQLREHPEGLLVNDEDDPAWQGLGVDIPYKLLCVPLVDSRRRTYGFLVCLRRQEDTHFVNSDRNLLKVVGRKAGKIVQSMYDELTGIYNRRALESLIGGALEVSRDEATSHCVLSVNIDQVKMINDAIGRDAGDHVIEQVALALRAGLRSSDDIGYLGNGKYAALVRNTGLDTGAEMAEKMRALVEQAGINWQRKPIAVTVTIGVSRADGRVNNLDETLEAAELALDCARQHGRNQIRVFHQDDKYLAARKAELHWANYAQKALRENGFELYVQPIHPVVEDDKRYHFETLLRLPGEDGELVSPSTFLPAAETFNLMPLIDRWVIDATFAQLAAHGYARRVGEGIVAINLSGQTLANPELVPYISEKLQQHGIDPTCICFEITETAAFDDFEHARGVCQKIKALGCSLSLDDFGTGLSSFSYLQKLPVDYVKIDGSFVRALLRDKVSHAMVTSIIQVSHVMGLKTIAEFVENDVVRVELELMAVDYVQGYSFAKPLPMAEALTARITEHARQHWLSGAS